MPAGVKKAGRAWNDCVVESTGIQIRKTEDLNVAVEAALAACQTEEEALFARLQMESNFTRDEAMTLRPLLRARVKADMLELLTNGPLVERCRQALKEGRDEC